MTKQREHDDHANSEDGMLLVEPDCDHTGLDEHYGCCTNKYTSDRATIQHMGRLHPCFSDPMNSPPKSPP
jgi:hypothetical protein